MEAKFRQELKDIDSVTLQPYHRKKKPSVINCFREEMKCTNKNILCGNWETKSWILKARWENNHRSMIVFSTNWATMGRKNKAKGQVIVKQRATWVMPKIMTDYTLYCTYKINIRTQMNAQKSRSSSSITTPTCFHLCGEVDLKQQELLYTPSDSTTYRDVLISM